MPAQCSCRLCWSPRRMTPDHLVREADDIVHLSVVVTTYNNLHGLRLVLAGLVRQSFRQFELIVADDGSGPETGAAVADYAATAPVPVRHIWHPDQGVRKTAILNLAIREAQGDY